MQTLLFPLTTGHLVVRLFLLRLIVVGVVVLVFVSMLSTRLLRPAVRVARSDRSRLAWVLDTRDISTGLDWVFSTGL
jgi:hypothetical protein